MREKGQALVEMALMLPFLLILIVGMVELGVVLQRQMIVVNAAREGARFGAFGASPEAIHAQTLLAASQMLEFNENNATIVVILAEVNKPGTNFNKWEQYPKQSAAPHITKSDVFAQLSQEGNAGGLRLVIVDIVYRHESMLGLPIVGALAGKIPIGSWTVMRVHGKGPNK